MSDRPGWWEGTLFGVRLTLCGIEAGVDLVEGLIADGKPRMVALANAHTFNLAYELPHYRKALKEAGIVFRDGSGVSWALRRRGIDPGHNFVGTDFVPEFLRRTRFKGCRVFLLGAGPGVAEEAARRLAACAPGIVVTGCRDGYFPAEETMGVAGRIRESRSHILLVAMGNPMQELWIMNHLDRLGVPVCIGVGALFDYLSGRIHRAPRWVLNLGYEWVFRLLMEPSRLWRRYLLGNPKFMARVLREEKGFLSSTGRGEIP